MAKFFGFCENLNISQLNMEKKSSQLTFLSQLNEALLNFYKISVYLYPIKNRFK